MATGLAYAGKIGFSRFGWPGKLPTMLQSLCGWSPMTMQSIPARPGGHWKGEGRFSQVCPDQGMLEIYLYFLSFSIISSPGSTRFREMLGTIVVRGYDLLSGTPISQLSPTEAVNPAARTSIHPSLCLCIEAEPGSAGCGEHWRRSCAHFFRLLRRRHPRREKEKRGRAEGSQTC